MIGVPLQVCMAVDAGERATRSVLTRSVLGRADTASAAHNMKRPDRARVAILEVAILECNMLRT
jgi:hypothetical protein